MPSKAINATILKLKHSGVKDPVTFCSQNLQDKQYTKSGQNGRGIHIGSYMDFSAASNNYVWKKQTEGDSPKYQRKPDNVRPYMPLPNHTETNPHGLFRYKGDRPDAKEVVQN